MMLKMLEDRRFFHRWTAIWPRPSMGIFKADMLCDPTLPLLGAILILQLPFIECQLYTRRRPWCSSRATADGPSRPVWLVHQGDQVMEGAGLGSQPPSLAAHQDPH